MTTRALQDLIIPMVHHRVDRHAGQGAPWETLYADADLEGLRGTQDTTIAAVWADDLRAPGATLVIWTGFGGLSWEEGAKGVGRVPAGIGYAYLDPRRLVEAAGWNLQILHPLRPRPHDDRALDPPALNFQVWTAETRWHSLVRPLPPNRSFPLPRMRHLRPPETGEPVTPTGLLLGPRGAHWILWASVTGPGRCWGDQIPCADALEYGGRYGQEVHPVTDSLAELDGAIGAVVNRAVSSRLHSL